MFIRSNSVRGKILLLSIMYVTDSYFYYHSYRRYNHYINYRRLLLFLLLRHQKLAAVVSILYLWGDIYPVLNGLCETIGNRLHCRHFRLLICNPLFRLQLQARWQSVLVRLQYSVSSSRCCSQNCWNWLLISATQHPELRYWFISQPAFAICIRVSNWTFHKRKHVQRKIVIKRPKYVNGK
jgi:hypothetical protein